MKSFFQKFSKALSSPINWLVLANVLLVTALIIFNNFKIIPLGKVDFIFFASLAFIFALYRPNWAFLFFVGTIPLENINLAPGNFGVMIRPYQFIGTVIILAVLIRLISGKLKFKLARIRWFDLPIILMNIGGLLSLINAQNKILSLKLVVVLATFSVLYFLVRNFIQSFEDVRKIAPFFLSSSVVVVAYGIWQNCRFVCNLPSFEVMLGRPNSTFSEPDWLGLFLALLISFIYIAFYEILNSHDEKIIEDRIFKSKHFFFAFLCLLLFASYVLLIVIVTRSAWLGALAATLVFLFSLLTKFRANPIDWQWGKAIEIKIIIVITFLVAIGSVYYFDLTNFQLFSRVQSTATGLQKITISCGSQSEMHKMIKGNSIVKIEDVSELEKYNCRHINLEERLRERIAGNTIYQIYRLDPNIHIREEIYQKSWQEIKKHPILGIGWGNISEILGKDGRGEKLNSSNIFFEVWLGSGILGLGSILFIFAYIIVTAIKKFHFSTNLENKAIALFLLASSFAIIIPNLFNAGIFLGFLWLWLGLAIFLSKLSNNL